jgi:site-specific recombinase XerD
MKILYKCENCGKVYGIEADAVRCEEEHKVAAIKEAEKRERFVALVNKINEWEKEYLEEFVMPKKFRTDSFDKTTVPQNTSVKKTKEEITEQNFRNFLKEVGLEGLF